MSPRFHNPYSFAPCPTRNLTHPFAGDHDPTDPSRTEDHSRYWPGRFSGSIEVKMTVVTPLLLPKIPEVSNHNGHRTYDPLDRVPVTSFKGMIRSAYEIITNSRFGVLGPQHRDRLSWRRKASAGVVPGQIRHDPTTDNWAVHLYCGTSTIGPNGKASGPLYAAWIDAYPKPSWAGNITALPATGTSVHAALVECGHQKAPGASHDPWTFWLVVGMWDHAPSEEELSAVLQSLAAHSNGRAKWSYKNGQPKRPDDLKVVEGIVVQSGPIAQNKHCERLFFDNKGGRALDLPKPVLNAYNLLLRHYREVHEGETATPRIPYGRHITTPSSLSDGDFVYVQVRQQGAGYLVEKIFPVQISRDLHDVPPLDCLDRSLKPASCLAELSPADRLFGWTNPSGHGAWRGKVRIEALGLTGPNGQEHVLRFVDQGQAMTLPLSILGSPKPSYGRFYVGDGNGNPQREGIPKEQTGYTDTKRLRGRKVFWNHKAIATNANYWNRPWQDRTANNQAVSGFHQEYRQPDAAGPQSNQNVSFTGWIQPGSVARFRMRVENLTREELGALLYLLELPEGVLLAMGHGKPLGFGRVRISLASSAPVKVAPNENWESLYWSELVDDWVNEQGFFLDESKWESFREAFKRAMRDAYSGTLQNPDHTYDELPFVKAFLHVNRGDNLPVHYPRTAPARLDGNGTLRPSYEWFVANDREQHGRCPGKTLPLPWEDRGLDYQP